MASGLVLREEDLTCSICCEIFKEPVVLKCSHSFCKPCLQAYWSRRRTQRDCPLCRTRSPDDPNPSLVLRNLCDTYVVRETEKREEEELQRERAEDELAEPGQMCPVHQERLKLFCLVDRVPICVVCHMSKKHKQHSFCTVSEAAADVKDKMKSALSSLQEKKDAFEKMKKNYQDSLEYIQVQTKFVERQTRAELERLHKFLQAEEESRLESLKREEEQKSREMKRKLEEMEGSLASVSARIRGLEEEMAAEDLSILQKCNDTLASDDRECEAPVMDPEALIDVAKHVGSLAFYVWEKMHKVVKFTPVILNPNTAGPWLALSDDLTSVVDSEEKQTLPKNPERFDPDNVVLGHVGFTTGRHAWDVSVGENTAWVVGVAKASVERKEKVPSVLKNGYMCVYYYHEMYFAGTTPLTRLALKNKPQKIRVTLDIDKGRVSFHNPGDNSHLHTFKHAITEKVYPYFWVACHESPVTVEPQNVLVTAVEYC